MMSKKKAAVFLVLSIIFFECFEARKVGGGGGGFARGGGAARMGPQQGTGGGAWGGGAHPPPPSAGGGFGGGQPHFGGAGMPQSNFRAPSGGGPGHFGSGTGLGSASRGSSFKTALAGAAIGTVGGLLAFEAGKAIIKSFDQPFHHENRDYYWGSEYARHGSNEHICTYDFDKLIHETPTVAPPPAAAPAEGGVTTTPTPEQALAKATFPNGTRPKQIVWACKNYEQCCGTDCCPMPQSSVSRASNGDGGSSVAGTIGKAILVLLLIGLIICCCCGLIMYKFCRSTFNSLNPVRTSNEPYDPSKYENQQPPQYGQAAQNYPMQPMMQNQGYPNSAYPAQPQPPAVYPAYPPAPAGYYGAENKY